MRIICEKEYRGVAVKGIAGDIFEVEADALVNPANSMLVMGGGLAGHIKRRGGASIEREAVKFAPVPVGKAIVTHAGRLPYRFIIHAPTMEKPAMKIGPENAYKAMLASLLKAFDLGLEKIIVPGLGTGVGGLSPREAAEQMARALEYFLEHIPGAFREILIVDRNEMIPLEFCSALSRLAGEEDAEDQG